jgi:hypothetical protein
MSQLEKDVLDVRLEIDHWKEPDPLIGIHKWQATKNPSEIQIHKQDRKLVKLRFRDGSIVTVTPKKIIYDSNDLINGSNESIL